MLFSMRCFKASWQKYIVALVLVPSFFLSSIAPSYAAFCVPPLFNTMAEGTRDAQHRVLNKTLEKTVDKFAEMIAGMMMAISGASMKQDKANTEALIEMKKRVAHAQVVAETHADNQRELDRIKRAMKPRSSDGEFIELMAYMQGIESKKRGDIYALQQLGNDIYSGQGSSLFAGKTDLAAIGAQWAAFIEKFCAEAGEDATSVTLGGREIACGEAQEAGQGAEQMAGAATMMGMLLGAPITFSDQLGQALPIILTYLVGTPKEALVGANSVVNIIDGMSQLSDSARKQLVFTVLAKAAAERQPAGSEAARKFAYGLMRDRIGDTADPNLQNLDKFLEAKSSGKISSAEFMDIVAYRLFLSAEYYKRLIVPDIEPLYREYIRLQVLQTMMMHDLKNEQEISNLLAGVS